MRKTKARQKRPSACLRVELDPSFVPVMEAFASDDRVTFGGQGFGSRALRLDGKIFAMLSSRGQFVVKLPRDRVVELIRAGKGEYFDTGRDRIMKEWIAVTGDPASWLGLAREAHRFARRNEAALPDKAPRVRSGTSPGPRSWKRCLAMSGLILTLGYATAVYADLPAIQARGALRVLVSTDENPSWFAVGTAASPGFEREILEGFSRVHNIRLEVVPVTRWERVIPDLLSGDGDVIAGINDTPLRRQQIDFTSELMPSRHIVVTHEPSPAIRSVQQLVEERVGVIAGTTWAEAVEAAGVPKAHVKTFPDLGSCLEALRAGQVDTVVMDVVDFLMERRSDAGLQDGIVLGEAVSSAWGVRKADQELKRSLEAYLQNLKRSGSWSRLVVKYFGEDALRVLGRGK